MKGNPGNRGVSGSICVAKTDPNEEEFTELQTAYPYFKHVRNTVG